ncbi:MAG: cytochrome P450 [Gemmataceae bacterium]|nr:cytochrome P450 [Gemmataceae bacterium]
MSAISESTTLPSLLIAHGKLLDFPADPIRCMRELQRRHGDVAALEECGSRLVFVFSPELNQKVLTDMRRFHARFFAVRGPKNSSQRRLTCGILSMNGEEHKRHRRLVAGPFQKQAILGYHADLVRQAEQLAADWKPGQVRDLDQDMNRFLLGVTSQILFGFDQRDLAYEIGRATERWVTLNHEIGMGALVADTGIAQNYDRLLHEAEGLEKLIQRMIELRRNASALSNDVLSLLIRARDDAGQGLSEAELIGQAAVLFGAAHLTTANSLTWTLFLLAQHPRVAHELVEELRAELGGQAPTWEQLERLPLLERVIKESMRVLPASGYSQRITTEPVDLGPLPVLAHTVVIFSQFMTHHREDQYPEPERFRPERWLTINPGPYAYMPFANGPRHCLGSYLALMIMKIALPVLLQRFCLQLVPNAAVNGKIVSTMLGPMDGVPVQILPPSAGFRRQPVRGNIHELVDLNDSDEVAAVAA